MTALIIIAAVVLVIALTPVGASASNLGGELTARLIVGPVRITLFPRPAPKGEKREKPRRKKRKKSGPKPEKKPHSKLCKADLTEIVRLGLKTLGRLRRRLRIDELRLYVSAAADDPFDAVKLYGTVNAALGVLLPPFHAAFNVKKEDIQTQVRFDTEKTEVSGAFAATFRICEIIHIAVCAAIGYLLWTRRRKKRASEMNVQRRTA